jgi:signal transduction histidine kinase
MLKVKADITHIDRLESLSSLKNIPRNELQWLVDNGFFETWEVGEVVGPKGKPIKFLWIVFSGKMAIRVDRGVGARLVTEWVSGDVGGMLPYSRMISSPGDNYVKERSEMLSLSVDLFPEMILKCPLFTAHCVHSMLDRVRNFNTSDLQDEKMASLGKLAAGLAHELNNPASATVRDSKLLLENLLTLNSVSIALSVARLDKSQLEAIKIICKKCLERSREHLLSPIERADYQDSINAWLQSHKIKENFVEELADTMATVDELDKLAASLSSDSLEIALKWIVASYTVNELAMDMERSAKQIHKLVDSVKKFTYLDNFAEKTSIDVEQGIRDTISVLTSKFRAKKAYVKLNIEDNLPHVHANGNELNQVWLILIDNALDAIGHSGQIEITACAVYEHVEVKICDNGPGIVPEIISRIFDPFFTTKPPGQGTGLGLDIARRLIRRYGGDLSVQSQPGRTEFTVSLLTQNRP